MKFSILWMENLTSAKGTNYIKATIKDESGREVKDVAIFSFFNQYAQVMPGATVEGVLETKVYNGKESYSLVNIQSTSWSRDKERGGANRGVKSGAVEAAKITSESVKSSQDRNELGYQAGGSFRDATLLTTMELQGENAPDDMIKAVWKKWRAWLWNEYWKEDKDFPPFN